MAAAVFPVGIQQFLDDDGHPLAAGKLWTYEAGTSNLQPMYTTSALTPGTEFSNPIVLNSAGRTSGPMYGVSSPAYDLLLTDSADATIWFAQDVQAVSVVV